MIFGKGIHGAMTCEMFRQLPRKDQDDLMQNLYDRGYTAKDIGKFLEMSPQTIYSRINAHRGRSKGLMA